MMMKRKMYCIVLLFLLLGGSLLSQSWQSFYNGSGNGDDESRSVCTDDSGNVYVTGFSLGINSNLDIVTIKYGKEGDVLWLNSFNGTGNSIDKAFGIVQDEYGFIYVGGYTTSAGGNEDIVLLRYNSAGTLTWSRTYNHSGSSSDQAWGIVVDITDRVYIYLTGTTRSGNNNDYLTVKYRDDGVFKWSKTYDRGQSSDDRAIGIATSTDGNIFVTGSSQGSTTSFDYYTIKYTSEGIVVWTKRYNGSNNGEDRAFGIVTDNLNNVTVTGFSMRNTAIESRDVATIQYDKNGYVRWTKIYNGPENSTDDAFGIVVDDLDNIYIAGSVRNGNTSNDFLALKYNQSGTEKWTSVFNTGGSNSDNAYCLSTSNDGQYIYLAGSSIVSGNERISVAKLNSNGAMQQSILYPGGGCATTVSLNNENNLFLGGYYISNEPGSMAPGKDYITMEFPNGFIFITAINENGEIPRDYALYQNYPNPFNPSTKIKFDLPTASYVRLVVYTVTGEELTVLADSEMQPGSYEVSFGGRNLSSGLYFYKLLAGNNQFVRKMIIVK
jgi:uncharacterized delta-60 repeat protein